MTKKIYVSDMAKFFEAEWFEGNNDLYFLYNKAVKYLISQYNGEDHRAVKGGGGIPKYRFNKKNNSLTHQLTTINVIPFASKIVVRFLPKNADSITIKKSLKRRNIEFKHRANANGDSIKGLEVKIEQASDIQYLRDVLTHYTVENFNSSPDKHSNIPQNEPIQPKRNQKRVIAGKEITASQNELELSARFVTWINSIGASNIAPEQLCNERDRIDVAFELNNESTIAELKSLSSYNKSAKRAIRAALGQLLDYQYFDRNTKNSKLWIVLDGKISQKEMDFISRINTNHKLSVVLIFETEDHQFHSFPRLNID